MIEVEEALSLILEQVTYKNTEAWVNTEKAYGMIVARDLFSKMMIPPFSKSAMDGYAVKAADIEGATKEAPVQLRVTGELLAGDDKPFSYEPKTAIRIMTGAMLPEGYDAVVKQEDTDYGEETVAVFQQVQAGMNVCELGEDLKQGDLLIKQGTRIEPVHMGLFASVGMCQIPVIEPVKVALIATGSEIMTPGDALLPGKIYNSISYLLAGSLAKAGFTVVSMEHCADEEDLLAKLITEASAKADVVITTGAVSVGKKDIVPRVLETIGAKILFRRVNIQPGTPTTASIFQEKLILSLSGNPYAAQANFDLYFWPVACKLMGNDHYKVKKEKAVLASPYSKKIKLRRLVRAYAKDGKVFIPSSVHASSVISNLTACNCYIDLEDRKELSEGDVVTIRWFC